MNCRYRQAAFLHQLKIRCDVNEGYRGVGLRCCQPKLRACPTQPYRRAEPRKVTGWALPGEGASRIPRDQIRFAVNASLCHDK